MKIGDEEITRDMMPAMQAYQMNPDHLRQSIQDVLNANLNTPVQMPQQTGVPMQGTMDEHSSQWK